jgi:hypothetical protein
MTWDLTGQRVSGAYLKVFPFTGEVTESRVKYGGRVQHTVKLDTPLTCYGSARTEVLVDEDAIDPPVQNTPSHSGGFYDIGRMSLEDVRRMGHE